MTDVIEQYQQQIARWSEKNFPADEMGKRVSPHTYHLIGWLISHVGKACHHTLKAEQGIRGDVKEHERDLKTTLEDTYQYLSTAYQPIDFIDEEDREWPGVRKAQALRKLMGVVEECGELVRALQPGSPETDMDGVEDALADIFIFLCDLSAVLCCDLSAVIETTLDEVLDRDWEAHRDE